MAWVRNKQYIDGALRAEITDFKRAAEFLTRYLTFKLDIVRPCGSKGSKTTKDQGNTLKTNMKNMA